MTLAAGMKLGPYEVLSSLGVGGMGEVYRARDTKLNREVALKVLPEAFAKDMERMARFQREAQVLASLNHPNIATIHGLEEAGSIRALVMELVEGPTLAEWIAKFAPVGAVREPPPLLEEALPIAKQIAEALEYAHERGIIHRDLKPANIKVSSEGAVKILDFGLAKALDLTTSSSGAGTIQDSPLHFSPTLSIAATQAGVILGTAGYMSPEQARGKSADRRADIWAFGCVFFEMLTGQRTFGGDTVSDTLAEVLKGEPDWRALPAEFPRSIQRLLRRCLAKDPKQRLQAMGDARIAIEEVISGEAVEPVDDQRPQTVVSAHRAAAPSPLSALRLAVGALVLIGLAVLAGWWIRGRQAKHSPGWSGDLLGGSNIAFGPRVSPDGHTVAFEAMVDNLTQLAVMNPDSGSWTVLTRERQGLIEEIAWSRDGSKLYFDRVDPGVTSIYTIPALGGQERLFLENAFSPTTLPDGSMLVARLDAERNSQIFHYWPDSGRLQPMNGFIWKIPSGPHIPIRVFPDGREAVFFGTVDEADPLPNLYALDIASGKAHLLDPELSIPATTVALPMAPSPDGRSVLIDLPSGSLHQIVAVPRSGSGPVLPLMTLTTPAWYMDCGIDGSIYVDQVERPLQVLRFPVTGGTPEVLAASDAYPPSLMQPVVFPTGDLLIPALISGHARLLVGKPNGNFFPLVDTAEETEPPAALLQGNQVAFVAGSGSDKAIALASVSDGRIIRRLAGSKGKEITSLAASLDGATLYYTAEGNAWAIPAVDGTPHKIGPGDGVAVDPNGKDLFVNLWSMKGPHLFRVPLPGDREQEIRIPSGFQNADLPLAGNALSRDGKLLIGLLLRDSWFYTLGVFQPGSDKLTKIPLTYVGDVLLPGWTEDGRILAFGEPMRSHVWRFRPIR